VRALLDINVVIALLDADHDFHHRAHTWWRDNRSAGWASCPLTENGVIRIMSNPAYNPRRSLSPAIVTGLLRTFTGGTDHEFWADSVSILDSAVLDMEQVLGPRQITDTYLLALAAGYQGRLVTFDGSINRKAARGARSETLEVI
jgi:toxin-antitoxin system PIN domain toxin